jgi:hypothetical protein
MACGTANSLEKEDDLETSETENDSEINFEKKFIRGSKKKVIEK